jgi:hypothetical protein
MNLATIVYQVQDQAQEDAWWMARAQPVSTLPNWQPPSKSITVPVT